MGIKQVLFLWDAPSVVADITHYVSERPSDLDIEVVQDASLLVLERAAIIKVLTEYPEGFLFLTSILLKYGSYHQDNVLDTHKLNGFERVKKLLSTRPKIDEAFSSKDLASLLGISYFDFCRFHRRTKR